MWRTFKQAIELVGRDHPVRWGLILVLNLFMSILEMVGAVLVYTLMTMVTDPASEIVLPVIGDARELLGDGDDQGAMLLIVALMAAFFVARGLLRVGITYVKSRVVQNTTARLSTTIVHGYFRWPYAAHLHRNSSELIRNGHQAVMEMSGQVISPGLKVFGDLAIVIGLLLVLIAVNPIATLLAVAVIGGTAIAMLALVQPRLKRQGQFRHAESKRTLFVLQQSLQGIRDIKLLGREEAFATEYGRSRRRMARAGYLQQTLEQVPQAMVETALLGFILGFFAVAVTGDIDQATALSTLGLFAYAGLRIQPAVQGIVIGLNKLKYAAAPIDDVHRDYIDGLRLSSQESEAATNVAFEESLRFEGVRFRYDGSDVDALTGIDVKFRPGQQIGICGPTGGGKTTFTDLLTGLLDPTEGRVTVDDVDVRTARRGWQANLGVVPQTVFLTDDTFRRNIALGIPDAKIDEQAVTDAVRLAQLDEFVQRLPEGLDTPVGERGVRISGGQRQRLAIARALYRRPSVLVFDEGTSALDNTTESLLMEAIESLRDDHTIILVAHRLSTVRNSDVVMLLEQGKLEAVGTFDELTKTNERFRKLAALG